jgi:DNA-binding NarL/FixJ family response regulator
VSDDVLTSVVVDDHPAVVAAVRCLFAKNEIEVLGDAADGHAGVELIREHRPRVAIVDLRMPGLGGTDVARIVSRTVAETGIVIYAGHGDRALLLEALDAGVRGLVLKDSPLDDLVRAVHALAGGGTYVDPGLSGTLVGPRVTAKTPSLTRRERDVLRLLAAGLSNEEVGRRLFISGETVRTHVRSAMAKLNAATRTQAVATAIRSSLIR